MVGEIGDSMGVFLFYIGKSLQAVGLVLTGIAVYRGIFYQASMSEEIQLTGAGIGIFLLGWLFLNSAENKTGRT